MAGSIDNFLKVCAAASIVLASASVAYYHLRYLPDRDDRRDREAQMERVRSELAKKLERERTVASQKEEEERKAAMMEDRKLQYNTCILLASANYSTRWDAACKRRADDAAKRYANCVRTAIPATRDLCDANFEARNKPTDCTLPRELARDYETDHDRAKNRCFQEFNAGLQ